uniref:Integrase catalytic domain-containing protein n=1 Tax=Salarias fasciatus TaxID=181472 RepID=A0A672HFZ9_SALFA
MDLFVWEKKTYLVAIDYFSRYIEVAYLQVASTETVISALKNIFARHGVPVTLMSDNGPQYASTLFKDFASEYGFTHMTSSPRYPQANGEAERAVATVKGLWKEGGDYAKALLSYRATPLENGYSPGQLLMGRQLRTTLLQVPKTLTPCWPNIKQLRSRETQGKQKQEKYYNKHHRTHKQPELHPGQTVWITTENTHGTVVNQTAAPRSYLVRTGDGLLRRNRSHLRATQQPPPEPTSGEDTVSDSENQLAAVPEDAYITRSGRRSRPPKRLDL